jgi:hydroxyacylglutathione hydrolase
LISPPDGDVGQFLTSLDRIDALAPQRLFAGHGAPVDAPADRIGWLRAHRLERVRAAREALTQEPQSLADLVPVLYADVPAAMWPAAARNLLASLIELESQGLAQSLPSPGLNARFKRL